MSGLRRKIGLLFAVKLFLLAALVLPSAASSSLANAAPTGEHLVTIHDRGVVKTIMTKQTTLREVLREADYQLDRNDMVEPGLDEELVARDYQVNIYRARPIVIHDGPVKQLVMSSYQTPKQIAKHAGIELHDEDQASLSVTDSFVRDGASTVMTIDRATPVTLVLYGKKQTVYTQAAIVSDFLKEKDITLTEKDTLSVKSEKPITADMKVEIWRDGKQTVTRDEKIDFEVEQIEDANRPASYKKVTEAGEPGKKSVTYEIIMRNGKEIKREKIQSVTLKKPVKQVEVVGTKFKYTGGPLSNAQITALGRCESGMTANRNSGNGFYGAFQFMPSTWRTVAPSPYNSKMPHEAPLDAQKQAVQNLLSRSSIYTQFPGCAKKMQAQGLL